MPATKNGHSESALDFAAYVFGSLPPVEDLSHLNEEDWPVYVRHLVNQYGPQQVWSTSLAVLNYPPTWVRGAGEAMAIETALQSQLSVQTQGAM